MIVRAPATTANLGPGFDCAAVALDLWNELEVEDGKGVAIAGEGAGELPEDWSNLAIQAYSLLASPEGKRFSFNNRIPLERGLGSSAAAIALGLAAAAPGEPAERLLQLGSLLEGHSDNLAAALVGGACLTSGGRVAKVAETLPVVPLAIVPQGRVSTKGARAALPETVSHADAAFTAAHAALLGAGLASGRLDVLAGAFEDRLHEPYRAAAAPLLGRVRAEWPTGAIGVTLSGSGPTVIVWARPDQADDCESLLARRFRAERVLRLAVAPRGAL